MLLRTVIRRTMSEISNKDPYHVENAKNDHYKKTLDMIQIREIDKVVPNFNANGKNFLETNEIETRILRILYESELIERLEKFEFSQDLHKELNLDSLNITVLLTSIQHEFTTVFEDRVFESVTNFEEIVNILARDPKII